MTFCIDFAVLKLHRHQSLIQCHVPDSSAKHECATRAHPEKWKIKAIFFFHASCGRIGATHLCTIYLRHGSAELEPNPKILDPPLIRKCGDSQQCWQRGKLNPHEISEIQTLNIYIVRYSWHCKLLGPQQKSIT